MIHLTTKEDKRTYNIDIINIDFEGIQFIKLEKIIRRTICKKKEKALKPSSGVSVKEIGTGGVDGIRGFIVAAYPGMGQEIYLSIYDEYKVLYLDDYDLTADDWPKKYVEDAIRLGFPEVVLKYVLLCLEKEIIEKLHEIQEPFLIVYPSIPKDKFLLRMFEMYSKPRSMHKNRFDNMLADVIKNYDKDIDNLKLYFNSISSSTGIINEEVLKRFVEIPTNKKTPRRTDSYWYDEGYESIGA